MIEEFGSDIESEDEYIAVPKRRSNGFVRFIKVVFVRDIGYKALALALGIVTWLLSCFL